jgi:ubiquinol-cytochrome c reductase cytochrome b subunit
MLHQKGSSNPIGIYTKIDKVSFYRFFIPKDIFGWIILFFIYSFFVFKYPNYLGHSDNYIEANPMVTPALVLGIFYLFMLY